MEQKKNNVEQRIKAIEEEQKNVNKAGAAMIVVFGGLSGVMAKILCEMHLEFLLPQ